MLWCRLKRPPFEAHLQFKLYRPVHPDSSSVHIRGSGIDFKQRLIFPRRTWFELNKLSELINDLCSHQCLALNLQQSVKFTSIMYETNCTWLEKCRLGGVRRTLTFLPRILWSIWTLEFWIPDCRSANPCSFHPLKGCSFSLAAWLQKLAVWTFCFISKKPTQSTIGFCSCPYRLFKWMSFCIAHLIE